jgi:predicted ArsR family transcriptional regulator
MTRLGTGESQIRILDHLKRRGSGTIPVLAQDLGLSVETVRAHISALGSKGLVHQRGHRSDGRGRPQRVYRLTESANDSFPNREGELLLTLVRHLKDAGMGEVLREFFREWSDSRRPEFKRRLRGLEGEERLEELARALTEEGYMAEVDRTEAGQPILRLCNCPLQRLVWETGEPCRFELALVREMIDDPLTRTEHLLSGGASCSYRVISET